MTHPLDDGTPLLNPIDGTSYTENQRYGFFVGLANWKSKQYQRDRVDNYPKIGDQLDMLWHELDISGSISVSGSWFNAVEHIKTQFPKP